MVNDKENYENYLTWLTSKLNVIKEDLAYDVTWLQSLHIQGCIGSLDRPKTILKEVEVLVNGFNFGSISEQLTSLFSILISEGLALKIDIYTEHMEMYQNAERAKLNLDYVINYYLNVKKISGPNKDIFRLCLIDKTESTYIPPQDFFLWNNKQFNEYDVVSIYSLYVVAENNPRQRKKMLVRPLSEGYKSLPEKPTIEEQEKLDIVDITKKRIMELY